jgi:arginyl-tRNA synthetase
MTIRHLLTEKAQHAMLTAGIPAECEPNLALSKNSDFGDYQINGAMGAAKKMGLAPRLIAEKIVGALELQGIAQKIEIAGPGFINIFLDPAWLANQLMKFSAQLNQPPLSQPQTIVVDYSGPNLAKEMHVGHMRSTIIGDAVVRALEYLGHTVIRQNHVGDWGTQFGMLIAELENQVKSGEVAELALHDLEQFYQQAKHHFDSDPEFANTAREYVVRLQSGDENTRSLWQQFRNISLTHSEEIYQLLNVSLKPEDIRGESFYNFDLPVLVTELKNLGMVTEDQGAQVVFLPELADKNGNPSPVIVQKKDGGYLYATSDLAAVRFRVNELNADRIVVFSDSRQALHMQQVYITAQKAGFAPPQVQLEHCPFGTMLGADGKPFKTRTGGTVKLAELMREAVERATQVIRDSDELSTEEKREVARKVGIGAIKYADLSKTRTLDYVFNWEQMLSFEGNTGPYLQYAYTRIRSIFRKAQIDSQSLQGPIFLRDPHEKSLALKIIQLDEVIEQVAQDAMPHLLCNYLYDLASGFMSFYEACPILKADIDDATKISRLLLSHQVGVTLAKGLNLLGIEVMEKM